MYWDTYREKLIDLQLENKELREELNRRENIMKYEVSVVQRIKYSETITGEFDNMEEMQKFVDTIMGHFECVTVHVTSRTTNMPEEEE